jgi:hypothetical protein
MADATYVYCVVKKAGAKSALGKAPKPMPGAGAARLLEVGDGYVAVVSSAPLAKYSAEAIEKKLEDMKWVGTCGAAHEAVVEHAASVGTVIPMKLFTLFASDERAADHVRKMKRALDRVVTRIAGCDEWGLRVLFDEARAAKAQPPPKRATTGAGFLQRKKEQADVSRRLTANAKDEVEDLFAHLEKAAKRAVRRAAPSRELVGRVLLDAVFLVPQPKVSAFKSAVAARAKDLARGGYHVTLTGPWPAYSFIEGR